MNKKLLFLLPGLAFAMTACGKDPNPVVNVIHVESVSLDKTTLEVEEGASEVLKATVTPDNASDTAVTWSSSDTSVATVSATGKVSGIAAGTATITVTTVDGGKTATCAVTVKQEGAVYGSVKNPKSVTEALAIAAEECAEPSTYTKERVYVKGIVRNKINTKTLGSGAKVWTNVYLKDVADSTQEILVYSPNFTDGLVAYQNDEVIMSGYITNYNGTIEFSNKSSEYPAFEAITHKESTITYSVEDGTITGLPEKGVNGSDLTFTVTPDAGMEVISVTANGVAIEPKVAGGNEYSTVVAGDTEIIATIAVPGALNVTASYPGGSTTNMTAGNNAATIGLDPTQFEVKSGNETGIYAGLNTAGQIRLYNIYKAENGTIGDGTSLTISSKAYKIVSIVINLDGGSPAKLSDITVKNGAGDVLSLTNGKYKVNNDSVTIKNTIEASKSTQLYISSIDILYVAKPVVKATSVSLDKTTAEIKVSKTETLTATILPENTTESVTWSSSDEAIATVSGGIVTGVAVGTCTIKAYTSDTVFAECAVTVIADDVNYGTEAEPLTVEQVRALTPNSNDVTSQVVWARGIVTKAGAYTEQSGDWAGYGGTKEAWIGGSDAETGVEIYWGYISKDVDWSAYTEADSLVGCYVTVSGYVKNYKGTIEFTANNSVKPIISKIENYGSATKPLSVEQVRALTPNAGDVTKEIVYATGVVAKAGAYAEQTGDWAGYGGTKEAWIGSDNKDTGVEIYWGYISKDIDWSAYTTDSSLVGATVVVSGYVKNFKGTIEFTANNNVKPIIISITPAE